MTKTQLQDILKTGDQHFIEVVKHSFWAIVMLVLATGLQFVFGLILARQFGAEGSGIFFLGFSVLMTLALIGRLGLDRAVVRFMPPLLQAKDNARVQGLKKTATILSLSMTIPLAILLFVLAPYLAKDVFNSADLTPYLRAYAFAVPPFSLAFVYGGILRALRMTKSALSVERVAIYTFGILAIILLGNSYGLYGTVVGFVASIFLTVLIGEWLIYNYLPKSDHALPYDKKQLMATAGPLLFVVFATQMNGQASALILGATGDEVAVGIFNIALRISMLMGLILTAINVIAATKITEFYSANMREDLEKLMGKICALGTIFAIPLFLIIVLFPEFLLGLFGPEFTAGSGPLIILSIGQLVNIAVGTTIYVLAMTGHEKNLAKTVGASLIFNIVTGIILIPEYKVAGAAITTSLTVILGNVIMVFQVKKYLGIWQLPFKTLGEWGKKLLS